MADSELETAMKVYRRANVACYGDHVLISDAVHVAEQHGNREFEAGVEAERARLLTLAAPSDPQEQP